MKVIFLGSPGVGKGTYASRLSEHYNIPHISTGDMFRAIKHEDSELGRKVKNLIENGQFVDDKTTLEVVANRLSQSDCEKGYILDGFPRTIFQAEHFEDYDIVINYLAREEIILERLTGRRTCESKTCQTVYHVKNNPPKVGGICDKCGSNLIQRKDEKPEIIKERLRIYKEKTEPLIEFYKSKHVLKEIDANGKIEDIINESIKILDLYK